MRYCLRGKQHHDSNSLCQKSGNDLLYSTALYGVGVSSCNLSPASKADWPFLDRCWHGTLLHSIFEIVDRKFATEICCLCRDYRDLQPMPALLGHVPAASVVLKGCISIVHFRQWRTIYSTSSDTALTLLGDQF